MDEKIQDLLNESQENLDFQDYLDLKMLALKSYDDGKTMRDHYTHHFNKIYRTQIEAL